MWQSTILTIFTKILITKDKQVHICSSLTKFGFQSTHITKIVVRLVYMYMYLQPKSHNFLLECVYSYFIFRNWGCWKNAVVWPHELLPSWLQKSVEPCPGNSSSNKIKCANRYNILVIFSSLIDQVSVVRLTPDFTKYWIFSCTINVLNVIIQSVVNLTWLCLILYLLSPRVEVVSLVRRLKANYSGMLEFQNVDIFSVADNWTPRAWI